MEISKRQLQKLQTRQKIIDTAYRLFANQGFSVSTSVIAKEAGIAHGSIFLHFPTLNDLLVCLLEDFGKQIGSSLHALSVKGECLEEMLESHLGVLENYENFYTKLISEMNLLPEEAKSTFTIIQSTAAFHFNSLLEREIEKGLVKNLPIHILFNTWLGLIHYYLLNREFFCDSEESVLRRYGDELLSAYITMISV